MKTILLSLCATIILVTGGTNSASSYSLKPLEGTNDPRQLVIVPSRPDIRVSPDPTPNPERKEPLAREKRIYSPRSDERSENRLRGLQICQQRWSEAECESFLTLLNNEGGWEVGRLNNDSYACGMGQSYPCTKTYPHATDDWISEHKYNIGKNWYIPGDLNTEIEFAIGHIIDNYKTPSKALHFWLYEAPLINGKHWY